MAQNPPAARGPPSGSEAAAEDSLERASSDMVADGVMAELGESGAEGGAGEPEI